MHRFLPAIGFLPSLGKKDMDKILGYIMNEPDRRQETALQDGQEKYVEISKEFGRDMGITIRGRYDTVGFFHVEHYFPYCRCNVYTATETVVVNKRVDTDAYTAMCDDVSLGVSLIFYLQNSVDYKALCIADNTPYKAKVSLAGLALQGMILLGAGESIACLPEENSQKAQRKQLLQMAKEGNQEAIDNLLVEDMDLHAKIMERIKQEDLYSIVETTFVPYGSESDNYLIIGTILSWYISVNGYTQEEVYCFMLKCNDLVFSVNVPVKGLMGVPRNGCRFKGVVWLQGFAEFQRDV